MKRSEDVMEILEAWDLLQSIEGAARMVGCDPKTVRHYVLERDLGRDASESVHRAMLIDHYLDKVEEWVERSKGRVRADVVHRKLEAMGYTGSERTTRRAVAGAKEAWAAGHRRIYRPWVPEPGMWFQWDWGDGPAVDGHKTCLWYAWLAWSRFRVIIPTFDRTLPTVVACMDATLRRFQGVPTYSLTDNERTVTAERVANVPVRHPEIVAAGRHYGIEILTCIPYDPESKGGSESTVKIAKADLVPTDANLLDPYGSFAELEAACAEFSDRVNARVHRETRRAPEEAIVEERTRLHPVPAEAHTLAFGKTRLVEEDSTIRFGPCRYSVPHPLIGERVWVRAQGGELVVVHVSPPGAKEVARHELTTPGNPRIEDAPYPERGNPLEPKLRPATADERGFLAIGEGARSWLVEAAACGATRIRAKMRRATELASLVGGAQVDRALGLAAAAGRAADGQLSSILGHLRGEAREAQGRAVRPRGGVHPAWHGRLGRPGPMSRRRMVVLVDRRRERGRQRLCEPFSGAGWYQSTGRNGDSSGSSGWSKERIPPLTWANGVARAARHFHTNGRRRGQVSRSSHLHSLAAGPGSRSGAVKPSPRGARRPWSGP